MDDKYVEPTNLVEYINLDYGAYILEDTGSFSEAVRYTSSAFTKIYVNKVRLPDGRANLVYLWSTDFDRSLRYLDGKHLVIPPVYRRVYYPTLKFGSFMGRRYRMNLTKEKSRRDAEIKRVLKKVPYQTRTIPKGSTDNTIFIAGDLAETITPMVSRFPIQRMMFGYIKAFTDILLEMSPAREEGGKIGDNHRILLIDAEAFKFKMGAPVNENKTNPLFLLYLAYMRTKNLGKIGVDMDFLITGKNLFFKFNPAKMDQGKLTIFRTALFKIMNANLDEYVDSLAESEKKELEIDSSDILVANTVDSTVSSYTKLNSPEVKTATAQIVDDRLSKKEVVVDAKNKMVDRLVPSTVKKSTSDTARDTKRQNLFNRVIGAYEPLITSQKSIDIPDVQSPKTAGPVAYKPDSTTGKNIVYPPITKTGDVPIPRQSHQQSGNVTDTIQRAAKNAVEDEIVGEFEDEIADAVVDTLVNDDVVANEIMDAVQAAVVPMDSKRNSPINSERDKKLREQQRKVTVKNSTIGDILSQESSAVPIETTDVSDVLTTTNSNVKQLKFANFDKTYNESLYTRDVIAVFNSLQDKSTPFYVTSIDVQDTSSAVDLKETWYIKLKDETGKNHSITVDMPKFYDHKFMWLSGNRRVIGKQNFYHPIVKDTPDQCIITTNMNKVTVSRKATKSFARITQLFSLINKINDQQMFVGGDSSKVNIRGGYMSSLEYDELSRSLFKFKSKSAEIFFNREYIRDNLDKPSGVKSDEFFIGYEQGNPLLIDAFTGLDRNGRTIIEIIYQNLPIDYQALFNSTKPSTQSIYAEGKLLGQWMPVIIIATVWNGISKALDISGIKWKFHSDVKRIPVKTFDKEYIRFKDGVLEYESTIYSQMLLNGLSRLKPKTSAIDFASLENEDGYKEYILSVYGNYSIISQLETFLEFFIDPITKDVCMISDLPTDPTGLLFYAVKALADNSYVAKASDKSYRIRSNEIIPAILYNKIAAQYTKYVNSGRRISFSIPRDCVIKELLAVPTVESYSTLNPATEVGEMYSISAKGYKGSNMDRGYDEAKRSYDESSTGKLAISTSPDKNVGVSRELVVEPTIKNARGFRDPVEDSSELVDVNVFSPVEMLTTGTARQDDPIRTSISGKQIRHQVPVNNATPSLVSNGFDEAIQFYLSSDFVVNADEDGVVAEVDEKTGMIVVEYTSGKTKAFSTNPEIVKNSNGGFYLNNQLTATVKSGDKFKKNEVLAYHAKYFRYSKLNGLRYSVGPLVKVAFMSTYNTYEDGNFGTAKLSKMMATSIVYQEQAPFKRNANITSMVKIGDTVKVGQPLVEFDQSSDDAEINKFMSYLSDDNKSLVEQAAVSEITTEHAGKIVDIKVYSLLDPDMLSDSLGTVVRQYFEKGISKKQLLDKFDNSPGILKSGYLLTDTTEPITSRYGSIHGIKTDVLIEFYIEHDDVLGYGDKIALYGPNKSIISELIPEGYEPYSELHPEEEISTFISPGTIARRMTSSVIPISVAMKCMIELKRKIKDTIKYG